MNSKSLIMAALFATLATPDKEIRRDIVLDVSRLPVDPSSAPRENSEPKPVRLTKKRARRK